MRNDLFGLLIGGAILLSFGTVVKVFPTLGRAAKLPSSTLYFAVGTGMLALWIFVR